VFPRQRTTLSIHLSAMDSPLPSTRIHIKQRPSDGFLEMDVWGSDTVSNLLSMMAPPAEGPHLLFLASVGSDEPQESAINLALSTGQCLSGAHTLDQAKVVPGSWLVVVSPPASHSVESTDGAAEGGGGGVAAEEVWGGGGGVNMAGRQSSKAPSDRSVRSLFSANSRSGEAHASTIFWKVTHASFPTAALDAPGAKDKLFSGSRLISSRKFKLCKTSHADSFELGREAYCSRTLRPPKPLNTGSFVLNIDFKGKYTNLDFDEVEVDCLLKLPAPTFLEWTVDPAAVGSNPPFFIAPSYLQSIPTRKNDSVRGPSEPPPDGGGNAAFTHPVPLAEAASTASSRFSEENYPPGATMYVVGEMYAPLGDEPGKSSAQKLLQAEKILQFLAAKEKKPPSECVLGMIFLGSSMNKAMGGRIYSTLSHYRKFLPCLWSLSELKRVLGQCVQDFQPAVELMLANAAISSLQQDVAALKDLLVGQLTLARTREEKAREREEEARKREEEARKREGETQKLLKELLERKKEKKKCTIA
jgi:hypothetical protein